MTMNVGKTVHKIFGQLPEKEVLKKHIPEQAVRYTNLHVHLPPNFGSIQSVEDAITHAKQEQIAVLGASNYYDHAIYTPFAQAALQAGITPVFGVEVLTMDEALQKQGVLTNDPKNPGKLYLCGKGLTRFDALDDRTRSIWQRIRAGDSQRIQRMLAKLNQIELFQQWEIHLQYDGIAQAVAEEKDVPVETVFLQERHLAQALQREIWEKIPQEQREPWLRELYGIEGAINVEDVVKVQNDLRAYLLKQGRVAYMEERFISPEEAARLIQGLGGYVSYPVLADGAPVISAFEGPPETLVEHLLEREIPAAEFIPTRNDLETLTTYIKTLRAAGIAIGAGTEHNDATWLPLLPHCKGNAALTEELLSIFWEGACVAAAHQYLQAKGQEGFRFLTDLSSRQARIEEMAHIGAAVIAA